MVPPAVGPDEGLMDAMEGAGGLAGTVSLMALAFTVFVPTTERLSLYLITLVD